MNTKTEQLADEVFAAFNRAEDLKYEIQAALETCRIALRSSEGSKEGSSITNCNVEATLCILVRDIERDTGFILLKEKIKELARQTKKQKINA